MATHGQAAAPNPMVIFDSINAYQKSMALKGAVELDLFTHIADGAVTAAELAKRCNAAERGVRILCDFLTIHGLLTKTGSAYGLTPDSALFLNRHSPAYIGDSTKFLLHQHHLDHFQDIAAAVRRGGSSDSGNMGPDDPVWVEFAESMSALAGGTAKVAAPIVSQATRLSEGPQPAKILDIAAGHGWYGIEIGLLNPGAEVVGADWKNVVEVARRNADKAGLGARYRTLPGSAFDVDFGSGYDLVLLPNFLHHFDPATNVKLIQKIRAAMKPGGWVATVEMVPNDDRVSPPVAAFSMMMLCSTPAGDAYTFRELDAMFREAGFGESTAHSLAPAVGTLALTKW